MDAGHYRRPQPRQPSVLSQYGYNPNYQAPMEYLEEYTREGQPFVRMVCAPGQRPDYDKGECVKGFGPKGNCGRDKVWNPFENKCSTTILPRTGWDWNGGHLGNTGGTVSSTGGFDWAQAKLPQTGWGTRKDHVYTDT